MKDILGQYFKIKRVILCLNEFLLDLKVIEKKAFKIKNNLKYQKTKDLFPLLTTTIDVSNIAYETSKTSRLRTF